MSDQSLNVLAVVGSLNRSSVTRVVIRHVADRMRAGGCTVDVLDLLVEPLPIYSPNLNNDAPGVAALKTRVEQADVFLLGTPDYHGGISGALKNFLDHFWREFAGKLFVPVVASHEKGLTVLDQLRTVARQCYAWVIPYGVSCAEEVQVKDGRIVSDELTKRLEMLARDASVYGRLLAQQRRTDLAGGEPGFMAWFRA